MRAHLTGFVMVFLIAACGAPSRLGPPPSGGPETVAASPTRPAAPASDGQAPVTASPTQPSTPTGGEHEPVAPALAFAPAPPGDDQEPVGPAPADERPVAAPNPPAILGGYTAPAPLPHAERARRYPRGDTKAARDANARGLERRGAGDHAGARAAYAQAVQASPAHAPARYNLACELARSGDDADREAAIGHLEDLLRIGSADARALVAGARFDEDFAAIAADTRFRALVASVFLDPQQPFGFQLCDDPGRIASLIDPARGLVAHVETETTPAGKAGGFETRPLRGRDALVAARDLVSRLTESVCAAERDPELRGSLLDYRLARAGAKDPVCLAYDEALEWSEQYLVCLSREPEGWRLASTARFPTGPLDESYYAEVWARVRKARDEGLARFGKAMARD